MLQNEEFEALVGRRVDVLRAPPGALGSLRHVAQATSLAWLQGKVEAHEACLDDTEPLARNARALPEGHRASES